jgi:hypothetical protein
MTHALNLGGGWPLVSDDRADRFNNKTGADELYQANPDGYFEPLGTEYNNLHHPARIREYDNKLIKVIFNYMFWIALYEEGFRVVTMVRHPEEIRQSSAALWDHKRFVDTRDYYDNISYLQAWLANRNDMKTISVVEYEDLCEDPVAVFNRLQSEGWEIDPEKAASVVDKKKRRYDHRKLVPGITRGINYESTR